MYIKIGSAISHFISINVNNAHTKHLKFMKIGLILIFFSFVVHSVSFLSKTCPPYFAWLCLFNLFFFLVEFNSFLSYRFSTILWTAIKMQIFSSKGFIFKWTIFFRFVFGGIVYFFPSSQRHWFVYAAKSFCVSLEVFQIGLGVCVCEQWCLCQISSCKLFHILPWLKESSMRRGSIETRRNVRLLDNIIRNKQNKMPLHFRLG